MLVCGGLHATAFRIFRPAGLNAGPAKAASAFGYARRHWEPRMPAKPPSAVSQIQGDRLRARFAVGAGQHGAVVREQPLTVNKIFHFNPDGTVYSRAEALIEVNGMVRFSFQTTKDAWYGQCASGRMLLLTYESLTRDPKAAMQAVYKIHRRTVVRARFRSHRVQRRRVRRAPRPARLEYGEIEGVGAQTRNGAAARPFQALRQRLVLAGSREQHPQGAGGVGGMTTGSVRGKHNDIFTAMLGFRRRSWRQPNLPK